MEIQKKLTYQFITIVALILLFASLAIYVSFSTSRKEEFYSRLANKTKLVAQMLVDIDEINAELLKKIEKNNPLSLPNEKIIIFDYQNHRIFDSDEGHVLKIPIEYLNKVRLDHQIRYVQKPYEVLGSFYTGEYDRIVVFTAATDIYGLNKLKRLRLILLVVFVSSLVIVYFAGKAFASKALQPVSRIISEVNQISIPSLNEHIDEGNGTDELARLAMTFNGMLRRIGQAFTIQKNFIANASHELRTPLTAISGQIEVILLKQRSSEDYEYTLKSVLEDMKNLNILTNKLLLLAQASSDVADLSFSPIRIDDTIWNARAELIKARPTYSINIVFSENICDEHSLVVMGNDLLLKTAIGNLMDNACKYSNDHRVDVKVDVKNMMLLLSFEDNGVGIVANEMKMIFEPFFRGKNAIGAKGHGIGLSLVHKIVQQHKGEISVFSQPNRGTTFLVTLPSAT